MKVRLDQLLVKNDLSVSVNVAKRIIMAGDVMVNEIIITKPGHFVEKNSRIIVKKVPQFVSRGGLKLVYALKNFKLNVANLVCLDVGSSTGGFTDCLLQNDASRVYSVDVGTNQLVWKLRSDHRVVVKEKYNFRYANLADFNIKFDLAVIDVSFISLKLIFLPLTKLLKKQASVVALIKPQFEGKRDLIKKGVFFNPAFYLPLLYQVRSFAVDVNLTLQKIIVSPIPGAKKKNIEFLSWFKFDE